MTDRRVWVECSTCAGDGGSSVWDEDRLAWSGLVCSRCGDHGGRYQYVEGVDDDVEG